MTKTFQKPKKDLLKNELIGLDAEVIESKNKANAGIKGKIIDETKNTIMISHDGKKKRLMKSSIKIKVASDDGEHIIIDCDEIKKKPEERLKLR